MVYFRLHPAKDVSCGKDRLQTVWQLSKALSKACNWILQIVPKRDIWKETGKNPHIYEKIICRTPLKNSN